MPKITYGNYIDLMKPGFGTAHRFHGGLEGNALNKYLKRVITRMEAWAGQDQEKNNQIAALKEKMLQITYSLNNLAKTPGTPVSVITFNRYINNFDMLQEVLQSECWPGGDTVFREMANSYRRDNPRYSVEQAENVIKDGIKYTTDVIFSGDDPAINYDAISQAQTAAEGKKAEIARQEQERREAERRRAELKALDDKIAAIRKDPEQYKTWLKENPGEKGEWLKGHRSEDIDRLHYGETQLTDEMLKGFRERELKEWKDKNLGGAIEDARNSPLMKLYDNLYRFQGDLRKQGNKDYDPAEADRVLKLADAIKYMGQGLGHGNHDNVYEDNFTQGWETMMNEFVPLFSQKKGDKTWFGWLQDKLIERGSYSPTKLNSAFDPLVNDYKIPISDELRNTGIVYSGMAGKMIQSYQSNGSDAKSLNKLIADLTKKQTELAGKQSELQKKGQGLPESENKLLNQIKVLLPKAQILKTFCTDPRMKDREYRTGDGKSTVTAALRSFNEELSSLEDRCTKTSFKKNYGEFFESWRQSKYEIKRDNVQDKTRTWKSYLEFHTGENADGREEEYLAKACVAWKHANENPQKKFSVKTARKEAAEFMKTPEYQALILDRKVTKNLLRKRNFGAMSVYLKDPYSYGTEEGKLRDALRNLKTISRDIPYDPKTEAERTFGESLKGIRDLSDNDINNISKGDAAKLLQQASVGASTFISGGQASLKSNQGRKFMNGAIDAVAALGDSCTYGNHIMRSNLKTAAAQFKTAGLPKLDSKLYGMKGRDQRKEIEAQQERLQWEKERAAEQKRIADLKKSAGKNAKLAYEVKVNDNDIDIADIAKLPKAGPQLKNPEDITDTLKKLPGHFDGTVGIPQEQSFRTALQLMYATAFNDNGKVVVDSGDYYNNSGFNKAFDPGNLRRYYMNNTGAWRELKDAAKKGGDYLGIMKKDFEALKKQKEQEAEAGPEKGIG